MTPSPSSPRPGRRAVLLAGLSAGVGGTLLAGCSTGTGSPDTGSRSAASEPELAPDVAVATAALAQVRAAREAVTATIARFPALGSSLRPVESMHRAHEERLVDAVPERAESSAGPAPYAVPARRPVALQRLAATERGLHDGLGGLALRAQSGEFAQLLAAMGSGVGQRLAGWPT